MLSDGRVLAWGENSYGQLGDGTAGESGAPQYVCKVKAEHQPCPESEDLDDVKTVSGGRYFALARLEGGEAVGWGADEGGELSGESSGQCLRKTLKICQLTPKLVVEKGLEEKPLKGVTAISAGVNFSLAVVNGEHEGEVYAFGNNERGQLGLGTGTGPEKCKLWVKGKGKAPGEVEEVPCAVYPEKIDGLSDVGGISAGIYEPGEGHSFAFLRSGNGPAPAFTVMPEEKVEEDGKTAQVLRVAWRLSSPKEEYTLKWKEEPPSNDKNVEKANEARENVETDLQQLVLDKEALEKLEEALEKAEEAKNEEARKEDETKKGELEQQKGTLKEEYNAEKKKAKGYEKAAEEEYPHSEVVTVNGNCEKEPEKCSYTVTEANYRVNGIKEPGPLIGGKPYRITLTRVGMEAGEGEEEGEGEAAVAHIVGTTLPGEEEG